MTDGTRDDAGDRASMLLDDIDRLPSVLRTIASCELPPLPVIRPRHLVLTGLGSSRFAALATEAMLRSRGLSVAVEHASTSRPAPLGGDTLVVGISNSGSTPETIEMLRRAQASGAATLAITNRVSSQLSAVADIIWPLGAGDETSGVASLTYGASVAALIRMAGALGVHDEPSRPILAAADEIASLVEARSSWLSQAADCIDGSAVHVIADAAALGSAEQAALLFRECPRLEADARDAGDWLHVGIYTALPGYRAVLLSGTPYDERLVDTIHQRGGRLLAIGPERLPRADATVVLPSIAGGDHAARALVEPAIAAALAAELWRRAEASPAGA